MLTLPPKLDRAWHNRGYYGSVSHDVKAVYQRYLGWFDGNPANLHALPPVESGKGYVELAGGADALLAKAREAYERGEYRWTAQLVNHLVFADPDNAAARELQADALEQMGYQAESGPWRNFYLSGAQELRDGVVRAFAPDTSNPDVIGAMSIGMLLDYLAIRLNGERAAEADVAITLVLSDLDERYAIEVAGGVLNHTQGRDAVGNQLTVTTSHAAFMGLLAGGAGRGGAGRSGRAGHDRGRPRQAGRAHGPARRVRVLVRHRDALGAPARTSASALAALLRRSSTGRTGHRRPSRGPTPLHRLGWPASRH